MKPPPNSGGQGAVAVEAAEQSDDIGDGSPCVAKVDCPGPNRDEGDGERDPQGQPGYYDTDDNPEPHGIMLPA